MMIVFLFLQSALAQSTVFVLQTIEHFDSSSGHGDVLSEKLRSGVVELSAQAGSKRVSQKYIFTHLCRRLKTISNAGLWVIVQTRFMPCLYFYSSLKINIIHQLMLTYQDLPPWNQETV